MLNPIPHTDSPQAAALYQTGPYVMASDVYALPPHTVRGGWAWYTGSASWMLRFILESLLGLRVEANTLRILPCLPAHWDTFAMNYRHGATLYRIQVQQTAALDDPDITVDGVEVPGPDITLVDDSGEQVVLVQVHPTGAKPCKSA